ncbi:hypothetical protein [Breoghania sp.]|uniref:hypothetical protein n=1 Tax=Breoghania sp. TaxID=2065378 RepID=UPI0026306B49|nr:hypothetical protein [Breoghania sp.]MDJ0933090.1 hypothetical protein [Breoghania sp.]
MTRKRINRNKQGPGLPNMSKVALLKWRKGYQFSSGVHRLKSFLAMAPDIVTLLHFKYHDDFHHRSAYFAERGQHVQAGAHYKHYASEFHKVIDKPLTCSRSTRFTGLQSLRKAGLIRTILSARS